MTSDTPNSEETTSVEVPLGVLITANYEALKAVLASVAAQLMGADPLTARRLFEGIAKDVDQTRDGFVLAFLEDQGVEAEVIAEEEE